MAGEREVRLSLSDHPTWSFVCIPVLTPSPPFPPPRPQKWEVLTKSRDGKLKVSLKWPEGADSSPSSTGVVPWVIAEGVYDVPAERLFEAMRTRK